MGIETALLMVSEIGGEVSAFPSVRQLCAWLGLAPNDQLSGSGQKRRISPRSTNRLGQALHQCAVTMRSSKSWLGEKHRRRLARMEKAIAVKATVHELARIIYTMLRNGTEYVTEITR